LTLGSPIRSVPIPSCSSDTFLSLAFDVTPSPSYSPVFFGISPVQSDISPLLPVGLSEKRDYSPSNCAAPPDHHSCSLDDSPVSLDNSHCLLEDLDVPLEQPGLHVESSFDKLCNLAASLSNLFLVGEAHYNTYGLKGSEREIILYVECVEPLPSLAPSPPRLVLDPNSVV